MFGNKCNGADSAIGTSSKDAIVSIGSMLLPVNISVVSVVLDIAQLLNLSELESKNTVSIPFHEELTKDEIRYIINTIKEWNGKVKNF